MKQDELHSAGTLQESSKTENRGNLKEGVKGTSTSSGKGGKEEEGGKCAQ